MPAHLRDIAPEGLAALSFLTDEFDRTREAAKTFASDVTAFDTGTPGVELFFCTMGGVPVEFMGAMPRSEFGDQRRNEGLSAPTRRAPLAASSPSGTTRTARSVTPASR